VTIIISGAVTAPSKGDEVDDGIIDLVRALIDQGVGTRQAANLLAKASGLSRTAAYQRVLDLSDEPHQESP
jgi:hypothetical protein